MNKSEIKDFLEEYNELLSIVSLEHKGKFAALASPTCNKQETVTFLYKDVVTFINNTVNISKQINKWFILPMFIVRLGYLFLKLLINSSRFRIKSLPENCIYIRTWLVPRSIKKDAVYDDYFRELIDALNKEHNVIVGFQPLDFSKLLNKFKKAKKPQHFILPIGLLKLNDILEIFYNYITTAKIQVHKQYLFKGKDISLLINNSLKKDYYNCRSFQAYLELNLAKKIKQYSPKIFMYIYENQAWENAYLQVFKGSNTKTIGYQSSGFSFRFLNFFPSNLDAKNALFPNKILTVGDLYTDILKEFGHYPIDIETFGALRFEYPIENGNYIIQQPIEEIFKRILYAFPVHYYQYPQILQELIDVFADTEIEVYLKFHPLYNNRSIKLNLPKNFYRWVPNNKKRFKELYDVVLFNDNSFGIESLIEGVKSYEYEFGELYPENRFMNFNAYNPFANKEKLEQIKADLLSGTYNKQIEHFALIKYINYNYKPYTSEIVSFFK